MDDMSSVIIPRFNLSTMSAPETQDKGYIVLSEAKHRYQDHQRLLGRLRLARGSLTSSQRMPAEGQEHCKEDHDCGKGGEEHTDLDGFSRGNHKGWKVLEDVLQFVGAGGEVVRTAGHICNLFERGFVQLQAKISGAGLRFELETATAKKELILVEIVATIHRRPIVDRPIPNGVHPNPA